jgi:hypothetical protein
MGVVLLCPEIHPPQARTFAAREYGFDPENTMALWGLPLPKGPSDPVLRTDAEICLMRVIPAA